MSVTAIIAPLSRGASGLGAFPTSYESDLAISKVTVGTSTDRDNLPVWKRLSNMECYVIGDNKTYRLGSDTTIAGQVWTEVTYGVPADVVTESELFDTNGFIKPQYIQNIFLNTNFVVPDQPSMLALTTFTGNFVIRTDTGDVWIKLNNTNPASIGDFALATPSASVVSVNGQTGVVNITIANLLADSTNLTNFNTAVSNNSTVLGHSSSISSLNSSVASLTTSLSSLSTYVDQHLGGKLLDSTVTSAGSLQDGFPVVWDNALNKFKLAPVSGSGVGASTFTALLDVPHTYTGQALKNVRVNAGETGLEFVTAVVSLASLTDVSLSSISSADFLQYRTSDSKWHNSTLSGDATMNSTGVLTVNWTNGNSTNDTRYLRLSGGTLTGNLILNADPVSSLGAATKSYVDNAITGLTWKAAVQVATAGLNITLSGLQVIDGYTTLANDRVLVKDQSTQTQNGIYLASSSSWTRTTDADTGLELLGSTMYVENGTLNGGTQWNNNNSSITLGSTNITFVKIAGAGVYTNGSGIALTGNVFSIATNGVVNSMIRQSAGLSVIGNSTNSTANVADVTGTNNQVLRVSGTTLGFGSIDLSQSATVGASVLGIANGGTGSATFTGWLLASGGTLTGANTITGTSTNTLKYVFNSLGTTVTDGAGAWLANTTAATNGNQQISPIITLESQGWDTGITATASKKIRIYNVPVQDNTGTSQLVIRNNFNGGSFNTNLTLTNTTTTTTLDLYASNASFFQISPGGFITYGAGNLKIGSSTDGTSYAAGGVGLLVQSNFGTSGIFNSTHFDVGTLNPGGNNNYSGFRIRSTFATSSGTANYSHLLLTPTINTTGTYGGTITVLDISAGLTSTTGATLYGVLVRSSSFLNGFGTATPTATLQVNGSGSNPTFKTVGVGTTTNYSYRAFQSNGTTEIFSIQDSGSTIHTQTGQSSGWLPLLTLIGGADTSKTAATEFIDVDFNLARNVQWAAGTVATQRQVYIRGVNYTGVSATATFTDGYSLFVDAPTATTNATLTNPWALGLNAGGLKIVGKGSTTNYSVRIFQTGGSVETFSIQDSGLFAYTPLIQGSSIGSSWTATATNQSNLTFGGTINNSLNTLDNVNGYVFSPTIKANNVVNGGNQTSNAVLINPTFSTNGGSSFSTDYILKLQHSSSDRLTVSKFGNLVLTEVAGQELVSSSNITFITFTQAAQSTLASVGGIKFVAGAHSQTQSNSEVIDVNIVTNRTMSWQGSTAKSLQRTVYIGAPTIQGVTAGATITDSSTLYIDGAPKTDNNTTNITTTNTHGVYIATKALTTQNTNSYGLTVNSMTGATNNYAAQFLGGFGVKLNHLIGNTAAPTIASGTGAGTSPTVTIPAGNDLDGVISIVTGTGSPAATAIIATITFNATYEVAPKIIIYPANRAARDLAIGAWPIVPASGQTNGVTTTTFVLESGTSLATTTTYLWHYHVIQ